MKISIIGTGYVGLVTGACFSDLGNEVVCVDVNEDKIGQLKKGVMPIYEPGLEEIVRRNYELGQLSFTSDMKSAVQNSTICFIAVGTPMDEDGSADMQYVLSAAASVGQYMDHYICIVDKSTVPVGSSKQVREAVQKELDKRNAVVAFDVVSNPEFLKEGTAVPDCTRPDRVVIGTDSERAKELLSELYKGMLLNTQNVIFMDIESAEMTKYAANCMLATKISFINEISNICELAGADINQVRMGIGSDHRIGFSFIYPGCGYGGSCFPKDIQALIKTAGSYGYDTQILKAVEAVNAAQKQILVKKIIRVYGEDLDGRIFAVWGLAFKPETDDMRESTSVVVINELTKMGAKIKAYDPKAAEQARRFYLRGNDAVEYMGSKYSALTGADALILVTEWAEFRNPDFDEMRQRMKEPVIFDGRNQYDAKRLEKYGFTYYRIGGGLQAKPAAGYAKEQL